MKLAVVIPAYNEEKTIGKVIREVPRRMAGIEKVEVIVIDDGSIDGTASEALKAGADRVIKHKMNSGLAASFRDGLDAALGDGADVIVNTDADFQYNQKEIPKLIKPILNGESDFVLGYRDVWGLEHMPLSKKIGNTLATALISSLVGFGLKDAQSGFRAFSREAALHLNVLSDYTYVQETIMQLLFNKNKVAQVPCEFRAREGRSRLISNIGSYAKRAGATILRTYVQYKPLRTFFLIGLFMILLGLVVGLRVLIHYLTTGMVSPYIPSAVLTAILLILGFQVMVMGLLADSINASRRINEECLYRIKKIKWDKTD
ncbi:glycosyltransferase family 2 protein [Candidatus Micrarchaeota archaeon]|nr:glycosyltransferase family 2 protein [Candidatus Micrarchaeota archaeon]